MKSSSCISLGLIAFIILSMTVIGCKKNDTPETSSIEGCVSKSAYWDSGIGGVRVRLTDPSGKEPAQEVVTASDGKFTFEDLSQNRYRIEAVKDGWSMLGIRYADSWDKLESSYYSIEGTELPIDKGASMKARIEMLNTASLYGDWVTITDLDGNIINHDIHFPAGSTTTSIWINNISLDNVSWSIDDVGDYWWIVPDIIPQSGTIGPQLSQQVVFSVNPTEYEENHGGVYNYVPITIWLYKNGYTQLYEWYLVFD